MQGISLTSKLLMFRRLGLRAAISNLLALGSTRSTVRLQLGDSRTVAIRRGTADVEAFDEVFLRQCYADDFAQLFGVNRRPEDVLRVLDVGAHVGCASLYFADRYPQAQVCAVEPDPANLAMLRRNVAGHERIRVVEGALWSESTKLALHGDVTATTGWRANVDDGSGLVRGLTVGELLVEIGWHRVDVMKIDIEGAEQEVFGADDLGWLNLVDLIMIELHDWKAPGSSQAFNAAVAANFQQFTLAGVVGALRSDRALSQQP